MLEWIAPVRCAGCGAWHVGRICNGCSPLAAHRAPSPVPSVRGLYTLTGYDAPLAEGVRRAKYRPDRALMVQIAALFADRMAPVVASGPIQYIVPAPSPWTRRLARGFSPAAVLARALSQRTAIPLRHALTVRPGPAQASLDARGRSRALVGRVRSHDALTGTLLLVDDVATTGATLDACSRELLGAGAQAIWAATVCVRRRRDVS